METSRPVLLSIACRGPRELRLQLPNSYQLPVKLAVTAWQRAAFDILHTLTPRELEELQERRAKSTPAAPGGVATAGHERRAKSATAAILLQIHSFVRWVRQSMKTDVWYLQFVAPTV